MLVDDGQIIVLGGLIQEEGEDGVEKVPGLGDVPVLGNLFKYQSRRNTKTNLMVFLRPTVIRTAEQSVDVMANRYDYIRGVQAQGQKTDPLLLPNSVPPTLPPMQDGRPVGGPMLDLVPRPAQAQGVALPQDQQVQPVQPMQPAQPVQPMQQQVQPLPQSPQLTPQQGQQVPQQPAMPAAPGSPPPPGAYPYRPQ